jgi:hypothetical protein
MPTEAGSALAAMTCAKAKRGSSKNALTLPAIARTGSQQIEHEHDDEHPEHDSLTSESGLKRWKDLVAAQLETWHFTSLRVRI